MKRVSLGVVLLFAAPYAAFAQETPAPRLLPFAFVAPGRASGETATVHFGGGLDTMLWKGVGAEAEIGYLAIPSDFGYGVGILSLDGVYQSFKPGRRVSPFVAGGYSLAFRAATANAINFGGGFNYWMRDGLALRVEFRDHLPMHDGTIENYHLWGVRIGLTWR